jgi:hypothetical protein
MQDANVLMLKGDDDCLFVNFDHVIPDVSISTFLTASTVQRSICCELFMFEFACQNRIALFFYSCFFPPLGIGCDLGFNPDIGRNTFYDRTTETNNTMTEYISESLVMFGFP